MRTALALLAVLGLAGFAPSPTGSVVLSAAPSDSIEYALSWPAAASPYGAVNRYKVVVTSDHDLIGFNQKTLTHDSVPTAADSFNRIKPPFSDTDSIRFTATITPFYAGVAGASIAKTWYYKRPNPAPAFPGGAVVTVDSSRLVRP
jgi:hypothetical protein